MTRGKINIGRPDQYPTADYDGVMTTGTWPHGRAAIGVEFGIGDPQGQLSTTAGYYLSVNDANAPDGDGVVGLWRNSGHVHGSVSFGDAADVVPIWHQLTEGDAIQYTHGETTATVPYSGDTINVYPNAGDPNTANAGDPLEGDPGDIILTRDSGDALYVLVTTLPAGEQWQTITDYPLHQLVEDNPSEVWPTVPLENITGRGNYGPGSLIAYITLNEGHVDNVAWWTNTGTAAAPTWVDAGIGDSGGSGDRIQDTDGGNLASLIASILVGVGGQLEGTVSDTDSNIRNTIRLNPGDGTYLDSLSTGGAIAAVELHGEGDLTADVTVTRADNTPVGRLHISDDDNEASLSSYDTAGARRSTIELNSNPFAAITTQHADSTTAHRIFMDETGLEIDTYDAEGAEVIGALFVGAGRVTIAADLSTSRATPATLPGTVTGKVEIFDADGASLGFLPIYDTIT